VDIQQKITGSRGSFFIEINGQQVAEMAFTLRGEGVMSIDHTDVDESLKGQSVGKKLLDHTVAYAQEQNLKIKPYCTFAKAMFEKNKEKYASLVIF
jgi:uncharacterized protein